jgi:hypothetical protein
VPLPIAGLEDRHTAFHVSRVAKVGLEMDPVVMGLWDMDEHTGEESSAFGLLRGHQMLRGRFEGLPTAKLEWVETRLLVAIVSGFGLVEDELGAWMVAKSREVHGRVHQIARELVESFGIGGIDGGAIVDAKTRVSPGEEEVDALLGNGLAVSKKTQHLQNGACLLRGCLLTLDEGGEPGRPREKGSRRSKRASAAGFHRVKE